MDKDDLRRRLDAFVLREAAGEKQLAAQEDAARCRSKALQDRQEVLQRRDDKLAKLAEMQVASRERRREKRARMDQEVRGMEAQLKLANVETETDIIAAAKIELSKVNNKHMPRARRSADKRQRSEEVHKKNLGHAATKWAELSAENEALKGDMEKLLREQEQGDKFGSLPGSGSGTVKFAVDGNEGNNTRHGSCKNYAVLALPGAPLCERVAGFRFEVVSLFCFLFFHPNQMASGIQTHFSQLLLGAWPSEPRNPTWQTSSDSAQNYLASTLTSHRSRTRRCDTSPMLHVLSTCTARGTGWS